MTRILRPPSASLAAVLFAAATLAALTLLAVPREAAARCVEPTPIEQAVREADVVFVGTVTAVANEGTLATVQVEEIWRGPLLDAEVTVLGGPGDGVTSVSRQYTAGTRYLFTIGFAEDGRLADSLCTSTTEWDAKLAALRPPQAMPPQPAGDDGAQPTAAEAATFDPMGVIGPAAVALLVAAALIAAGLLSRGRQAKE